MSPTVFSEPGTVGSIPLVLISGSHLPLSSDVFLRLRGSRWGASSKNPFYSFADLETFLISLIASDGALIKKRR